MYVYTYNIFSRSQSSVSFFAESLSELHPELHNSFSPHGEYFDSGDILDSYLGGLFRISVETLAVLRFS
jgi:hypothetical protein